MAADGRVEQMRSGGGIKCVLRAVAYITWHPGKGNIRLVVFPPGELCLAWRGLAPFSARPAFLIMTRFMKKRRYADIYGYSPDEFDRWLEKASINSLKCSAKKPLQEFDRDSVFSAYNDGLRKAPRLRMRMLAGQ
jgi:hypothetical protein